MAISKIDNPTASTPSYTPSISDDYNAQNTLIARLIRNCNGVSLTNWDATSTAPQVASGSFVEDLGVIYDITTDTAISTSGASAGLVYLVFESSIPEFKYTNTVPSWSNAYNSYYAGGNKATGHALYWDGSTSFTGKTRFPIVQGGIYSGYTSSGGPSWLSTKTLVTDTYNGAASDTAVFPPGYIVVHQLDTDGGDAMIQISDNDIGTSWGQTIMQGTNGGIGGFSFISDGLKFRYRLTSNSTYTPFITYSVFN